MESTDDAAARRTDPRLERIQRDHELSRALTAARTLQELLELADMQENALTVHLIRDEIAGRLADLVIVDYPQLTDVDEHTDASEYGVPQKRDKLIIVDGPPCQPFSEVPR